MWVSTTKSSVTHLKTLYLKIIRGTTQTVSIRRVEWNSLWQTLRTSQDLITILID